MVTGQIPAFAGMTVEDRTGVGGDCCGDGMLGARRDGRGVPQHVVRVLSLQRHHFPHARPAFRDGAGLVEDDGGKGMCALQARRILD